MKKHMGPLSVLLGIGGIAMLFLSSTLNLGIITMIGMVMVIVGILGAIVSNAIQEDRDITSWSTRPDVCLYNIRP